MRWAPQMLHQEHKHHKCSIRFHHGGMAPGSSPWSAQRGLTSWAPTLRAARAGSYSLTSFHSWGMGWDPKKIPKRSCSGFSRAGIFIPMCISMGSPDCSLKQRVTAFGNPVWMLQWPGYRTYRAGNHLPRQQSWPGVTFGVKRTTPPHLQQKGSTPLPNLSQFYFLWGVAAETYFKNHSNWNLELTMFL